MVLVCWCPFEGHSTASHLVAGSHTQSFEALVFTQGKQRAGSDLHSMHSQLLEPALALRPEVLQPLPCESDVTQVQVLEGQSRSQHTQ